MSDAIPPPPIAPAMPVDGIALSPAVPSPGRSDTSPTTASSPNPDPRSPAVNPISLDLARQLADDRVAHLRRQARLRRAFDRTPPVRPRRGR